MNNFTNQRIGANQRNNSNGGSYNSRPDYANMPDYGGNGGVTEPTPEYDGTINTILSSSIGAYVVCEFLIGTTILERREGILYSVGINFFTLYQPNDNRYLVCDLYSVKFIYFYDVSDPSTPIGEYMSNSSYNG